MTKKVAIMKGDGIGPEIVDAMTGILKECNLQSEMVFCDAGSEQWEKNGSKDASYIPESTMTTLEEVDACFKGPTTTIPKPGAPRSVAVTLRQKFGQAKYIGPYPIARINHFTCNHPSQSDQTFPTNYLVGEQMAE